MNVQNEIVQNEIVQNEMVHHGPKLVQLIVGATGH